MWFYAEEIKRRLDQWEISGNKSKGPNLLLKD